MVVLNVLQALVLLFSNLCLVNLRQIFLGLKHVCHFVIITLQEIDAITTQPNSENAASNSSQPEVTDQQPTASGEKNQQTGFEYDTQYSLAGGNCFKIKSSCLQKNFNFNLRFQLASSLCPFQVDCLPHNFHAQCQNNN